MNGSDEQIEDEFIEEEEGGAGEASVKKLREKLQKAVAEKQESLDGWQRARADLANFRRDEMQREVDREIRTKIDFAEALIPTLDAFDMVLKDQNYQSGDANFKKGIDAVHSNLIKSLERIGITRFNPEGEKFSPHSHEALREVPTENREQDHTIESVHAPGYRIEKSGEVEGRLIRPAQVSVYTYTKE